MISDAVRDTLAKRVFIEEELNKVTYNGLAAGSLLCHTLNTSIVRNKRGAWKEKLQSLLWIISRLRFGASVLHLKSILITVANNSERTRRIMGPITSVLDGSQYSLAEYAFFFKRVPLKVYFQWLSVLPGSYKRLTGLLNTLRGNGKITLLQKRDFLHEYIVQTFRAEVYTHFFSTVKPELILTDWDRHTYSSPLILAANKAGIKTVTLIHGAVSPPYLFVPFIAQTVFCWGQDHITYFNTICKSATGFRIVGSTAYRPLPDVSATELAARFDLPPGKFKVLFVSQNFPSGNQHTIVEEFASSINESDNNLLGMIKLHPADKAELFDRLSHSKDSKVVVLPGRTTVEEALLLADLVVIVTSTFVFDAVIAGKPICFFNPTNEESGGIGLIFHNEAGAVYLKSKQEFLQFLQQVSKQHINALTNYDQVRTFSKQYCRYAGSEAAMQIRTELFSMG